VRICIISPALPPVLDAIGHYTALLAAELSRSVTVEVLTVGGFEPDAIAGVRVTGGTFSAQNRRSVWGIAEALAGNPPDWILLQFNQFSYGRWGLNLSLPRVMKHLKAVAPATRVAVMFHEDFVPAAGWKFRVMRLWQKRQFAALGGTADVVFFSIDPWVRTYRSWFPNAQVTHLPVGSNIPLIGTSRTVARERLGIRGNRLVLGLFGTAHASRMLDRVQLAAQRAVEAGVDATLLYIGADGPAVRAAVQALPVISAGPLDAAEVSRRLQAVDVALSPFVDGVSTRRGSMLAGLQHRLATVGTRGPLTDTVLDEQDGTALILADVASPQAFASAVVRLLQDPDLRARMGAAAQGLYIREFSWERIAHRLLGALSSSGLPRP
jgi:glycosyltransferase involved in cell wall biosynthesis